MKSRRLAYYFAGVAVIFVILWTGFFLSLVGIWGGTRFLEELDLATLVAFTVYHLLLAFVLRESLLSRSS